MLDPIFFKEKRKFSFVHLVYIKHVFGGTGERAPEICRAEGGGGEARDPGHVATALNSITTTLMKSRNKLSIFTLRLDNPLYRRQLEMSG